MAQFDEHSREDDLGRAVRAAYETMGPTQEAQERMLAGLRAAVGQAEGAQEKGAQEEGACAEGARVRAAQAKTAPAARAAPVGTGGVAGGGLPRARGGSRRALCPGR